MAPASPMPETAPSARPHVSGVNLHGVFAPTVDVKLSGRNAWIDLGGLIAVHGTHDDLAAQLDQLDQIGREIVVAVDRRRDEIEAAERQEVA